MAGNLQVHPNFAAYMLSATAMANFNSGKIEIRSGTQPATAQTAVTGAVLATLTFNVTAFGAVANSMVTANAIASVSATGTGTATWARIYKADGTTVLCDVNIGTVAGAADMVLNSVSIVSGGTVTLSSFTISVLAQGD